MSIRKRLEQSKTLVAIISWVLTSYFRLAFATGKWRVLGASDLTEQLKDGPVSVALWHGRLVGLPGVWPFADGALSTIHDTSPAGRVGAAVYQRFGAATRLMNSKIRNRQVTREIIRDIRAGHSLGMAADGPKGPAGHVHRPILDWARTGGGPIILFTWSSARHLTLGSWDSLKLPLPFCGGIFAFKNYALDIPQHPIDSDYVRLSDELALALDAFTDEIDALARQASD